MEHYLNVVEPKLSPPTEHWKADLEAPSVPVARNRPCPAHRINYVNDVYLEVTTGDPVALKWLLLFVFGLPFLFLWGILELCASRWNIMEAAMLIGITLIYPLGMIIILGLYRDAPIRFNRKRQKIYMCVGLPALKPISEAIIEDWQNMRAELSERFERKSFSKKRILHKRIDLSVVASGTN